MDDSLRLDRQLCFALYACSKELLRKYEPLLSPLDLTYTQYILLLALWEKDGQTVKSLGETLYLDSGTLTPLIRRMETKGIVKKQRSKTDERSVEVTLTEKGRSLKNDAQTIPERMFCRTGLSACEAISLHNLLKTFLRNLEGKMEE